MPNQDSPDRSAVVTISVTCTKHWLPHRTSSVRLTLFLWSGMCGCWSGEGYLLLLQLDFTPRLGQLLPSGGEVLCPVSHIGSAAPHAESFADRISSTTEHFQHMISEHIKLALSSTQKSLGFPLYCQSKEEKRDFVALWTVLGGEVGKVQLTLKCLCVEISSYTLTSNVPRNMTEFSPEKERPK